MNPTKYQGITQILSRYYSTCGTRCVTLNYQYLYFNKLSTIFIPSKQQNFHYNSLNVYLIMSRGLTFNKANDEI